MRAALLQRPSSLLLRACRPPVPQLLRSLASSSSSSSSPPKWRAGSSSSSQILHEQQQERRRDGTDSSPRTREEFVLLYGGTDEWDALGPTWELGMHLQSAGSAAELLELYARRRRGAWGDSHTLTCWRALSDISRANYHERRWMRDNAKALAPFREHTLQTLPRLDSADLATIAECISASRVAWHGPQWRRLLDELAATAVAQLSAMRPMDVTKVARAFANAEHQAPAFFDAVMADLAPPARLSAYAPTELANLAWASATLSHRVPSLFGALEARLSDDGGATLRKLPPASITSLAWAFASNGHVAPSLFDALAAEVTSLPSRRLRAFKSAGLATLVWSFAKARHADPGIFRTLAPELVSRLPDLKPQDMSNVSWAYAKVGFVGEAATELFDALARQGSSTAHKFRPQDVSTMAWAFATSGHVDVGAQQRELTIRLFDALANRAIASIARSEFKPQALATTAWAFTEVQHWSPEFYDTLAVEAWRQGGGAFSDLRMQTMLTKAFAAMGQPLPDFEQLSALRARQVAERELRRHDESQSHIANRARVEREAAAEGKPVLNRNQRNSQKRNTLEAYLARQEKRRKAAEKEVLEGATWVERFIDKQATEARDGYFVERGGKGDPSWRPKSE